MANPEAYTPNEVVAIIERLEGKFQFVLDIVVPLPERFERVEIRLTKVEDEVRSLKDVIRVAIPDLTRRVSRLESKAGF